MASKKAGPWIAGAVVIALGLLAGAWFLLVSPQLEAASTAREEAEAARQQNVVQAQRLAQLKEQAEQLDTFKAELAAIRTQVPTQDGLPELLEEVNGAAATAGLTVLNTTIGLPEPFLSAEPIAPTEPAAAPTTEEPGEAEQGAGDDGAAADETSAEDGAAAAAPAAAAEPAPVIDGFVAIPVQLTVLGTYDAARTFTEQVQTGMTRLLLVTGLSIKGQEAAEPANGRPATQDGDAEMVVNGYVYVLDESAQVSVPAPVADTGESVN